MAYVESTWQDFYKEGTDFLRTSKGSMYSEKFSPEIIYNLCAMSIEKFFMALFIKINFMPYNHTLVDLVESIKVKEELDPELERRLLYMNGFQEICTMEQYSRTIPGKEEIPFFVETTEMVNSYITEKLGKAS